MHTVFPQEIQQVLKGLALNRQPGWNFPGNFLEVSFDELGPGHARLSIEPGRHCMDEDGQTNMGAVGVLADIGMAAAMRPHAGPAVRMATVAMALQFSGAQRTGRLEVRSRFDGFFQGASGRQGLTRAEVYAGGNMVCTASGSFLVLENHEGLKPLPLRRRGVGDPVAALAVEALSDEERAVYTRACQALEPGAASFIERFWGFLPQPREGGALCDMPNGLHVGNRVGHTQGGLNLAMAGLTANAALGKEWSLVGLSAWYVRPGTGPALHADATIEHQGSITAVVRVNVSDHEGRTVLSALANHARAAQ